MSEFEVQSMLIYLTHRLKLYDIRVNNGILYVEINVTLMTL